MIDYNLKNPPAFASHIDENHHQEGMGLRDYFAAASMGLVAEGVGHSVGKTFSSSGEMVADVIATRCYIMADAMLKARVK